MGGLSASAIWWIMGTVQCVGLASAWLARANEGSSRQGPCYCVFVGCLAAVGLATIVSLNLNPGGWFLSGTSLAAMVLAVTGEFCTPRPETIY